MIPDADKVLKELLKKPKYKKECVKKGMRGCVMREYAIKGQWQIKYSKKKCLL